MTLILDTLAIGARDPQQLAGFWGAVLDRPVRSSGDHRVEVLPDDATQLRLSFVPTDEPKRGQNRIHLDLTSEQGRTRDGTVVRALELGATPADVGQTGEEGHVVLADPEGNEFCVIEEGNNFLSGCGFVGAVNCDGTQALGYFWSEALSWPLVWDQDEETAIQAPAGGSKITWSGPPLMPRLGPDRIWFELRTDDVDNGRRRLVELGATDRGNGILTDPDGSPFSLRA